MQPSNQVWEYHSTVFISDVHSILYYYKLEFQVEGQCNEMTVSINLFPL